MAQEPISITRDNSGTMFPTKDTMNYHGAMMVDGKTFDVVAELTDSEDGMTQFFQIEGTERDGAETISLKMNKNEDTEPSKSGGPKPTYWGYGSTKNARARWRISVWEKTSAKGNLFLSMSVQPAKEREQQQQG